MSFQRIILNWYNVLWTESCCVQILQKLWRFRQMRNFYAVSGAQNWIKLICCSTLAWATFWMCQSKQGSLQGHLHLWKFNHWMTSLWQLNKAHDWSVEAEDPIFFHRDSIAESFPAVSPWFHRLDSKKLLKKIVQAPFTWNKVAKELILQDRKPNYWRWKGYRYDSPRESEVM